MKLLILTFALLTFNVSAKNYFVAKDGKDTNPGTKEAPFKTLQTALNNMEVGDYCYLREGIYRESVTIEVDGITISAYNNEKVEIYGTTLVQNSKWKKYKDNIYRAYVGKLEPQFTQLIYNNEIQKMARYPDHKTDDMFSIEDESGYIGLETKKDGEVIFDTPLPGGKDNWKGGYFRAIAAKAGATNPNGIISTSQGAYIKCGKISHIWRSCSNGSQPWKAIGKGKGYIYHLNALTTEGEWWYEDEYIYFWAPGGSAPKEVEVQKWNFVINGDHRSDIILSNINIRAASVYFNNSKNITLDKCTFKDIKGWFYRDSYGTSYTEIGGSFFNGSNIKVLNSYFGGSWGNLLNLSKCEKVMIDNCFFENNGWMGLFTSCIQSNSNNVTILNSSFGSTGRFHIRSDGHAKLTVKHNDFYDCMKMCQDAGSIELTNTGVLPNAMDMRGSEFAYNKFHDMNTLPAWTRKTQYVLALYFEGAENYTVHHNLFYNITNSRKEGTFLYLGPRYSTIKNCYYYNNTIWNIDRRISVWNIKNNKTGKFGAIENMIFRNNIFQTEMEDKFGTPSLAAGIDLNGNSSKSGKDAAKYFINAEKGDFRLREGTDLIDSGEHIPNINDNFSGIKPDMGCYEYGKKTWSCGSNITKD